MKYCHITIATTARGDAFAPPALRGHQPMTDIFLHIFNDELCEAIIESVDKEELLVDSSKMMYLALNKVELLKLFAVELRIQRQPNNFENLREDNRVFWSW